MNWIILVAFVFIIGSLASAGVFLVRDKGKTRNVARALTVRISLSVALFLLLLLAYKLGWIQPHGIPMVAR
ncbi:MAG: twin transmembrane helix small protein [Burkholderiaceae bacterium]|nr:twin transmembrane helix small protein [Burkholderiaceae bacterium]MEB2318918.1 twin transmembrane helix small protein [Pseudomonadota bacterium]